MLFYIHLFFMILAMFFFSFAILKAVLRGKNKNWFDRHKTFNRLGLIFMLAGLGSIFFYVQLSGGSHLWSPHSRLGLGAAFTLFLTSFLIEGILRKKVPLPKKIHPWMGRLAFILFLLTVATGTILFLI